MEAKWNFEKPNLVDGTDTSAHLFLLSNLGNFFTGYWNEKYNEYLVDSLLLTHETIVAWLDGISLPVAMRK